MASVQLFVVRALSPRRTTGILRIGPLRLACALGRAGTSPSKREGDGATPAGRFRPVRVLYRADKRSRPVATLPVTPIRRNDGWCDSPADRNYNRPVRLPYAASAESLWRDDDLYDIVIVLDHNARPRIKGHGSAIFMHVARPGLTPTEGCIALPERRLRQMLRWIGPGSHIHIPA